MTDTLPARRWFLLGLLNLAIVALFGTLMRYKIAFDFPYLQQKNLLHAHSHFAFSGWIGHFLYSGLSLLIAPFVMPRRRQRYRLLVTLNLLSAFGMLVAFTIQGYKAVSIAFSSFSIVIAVAYAVHFIRDSRLLPAGHPSVPWAVPGVLINVLSAAGPLALAYMIVTKQINLDLHLGSVYYYLHFQYNGWFFLGCMALVAASLPPGFPSMKPYARLFAITAIPTFFLSVLWTSLPAWLYVITVIAALVQLLAWIWLLKTYLPLLRKQSLPQHRWVNLFFYGAAIALTLKFILQLISVIPSLSQLVFGFRPIVIAYLHLVLLGVFTLFIIGYLFMQGYARTTKLARIASFGFYTGVLLNELFLGIQGIAAFTYTGIPYINQLLLLAACVLLVSAVLMAVAQLTKQSHPS